MKIDDDIINNLEKMSKLEISQQEKEDLKKDLNEAIEYFDKLKNISFENIGLLDEISESIFREDIPMECKDKESLGKYFSVPAVLGSGIKS